MRGLVCITESCWAWFGNSLSLGPEFQQFQVSAQRSINKSILPGRSDPLSFHPSPSPWERRLFNGNKGSGYSLSRRKHLGRFLSFCKQAGRAVSFPYTTTQVSSCPYEGSAACTSNGGQGQLQVLGTSQDRPSA